MFHGFIILEFFSHEIETVEPLSPKKNPEQFLIVVVI